MLHRRHPSLSTFQFWFLKCTSKLVLFWFVDSVDNPGTFEGLPHRLKCQFITIGSITFFLVFKYSFYGMMSTYSSKMILVESLWRYPRGPTLKCWFIKINWIIFFLFINIASTGGYSPGLARWFWLNHSKGTPLALEGSKFAIFASFQTKLLISQNYCFDTFSSSLLGDEFYLP